MTQRINPKFNFNYDGATTVIYHADKGQGLPRHSHLYSHVTFCVNGSCIIRKENFEKIVDKNHPPLNLVENEWHEIEALEDNTVFINIFAEDKI